jgi:hypothetical protein
MTQRGLAMYFTDHLIFEFGKKCVSELNSGAWTDRTSGISGMTSAVGMSFDKNSLSGSVSTPGR